MSYHLHNCRLVHKHTWLLFHHYTWKQKLPNTVWEMGMWRKWRYWWSLISVSSRGDGGRKYFSLFSIVFFSGFTPLRKNIMWRACPAEGSLCSGFLYAPHFVHSLGASHFNLWFLSFSLSCKVLTHGLRDCRGWFPLTRIPTAACYDPMGALRHSHSESGGRWCQTPSNQPSFHLLCVCSSWWRGPWSGLAVLSASKAALDTQSWCPWTPAGAGTCLFCGVLCGNVFNDRHVTYTVNVTNWALCNFKSRKKLCQIYGCRWQWWRHLVPRRPSWCASPTSCI